VILEKEAKYSFRWPSIERVVTFTIKMLNSKHHQVSQIPKFSPIVKSNQPTFFFKKKKFNKIFTKMQIVIYIITVPFFFSWFKITSIIKLLNDSFSMLYQIFFFFISVLPYFMFFFFFLLSSLNYGLCWDLDVELLSWSSLFKDSCQWCYLFRCLWDEEWRRFSKDLLDEGDVVGINYFCIITIIIN